MTLQEKRNTRKNAKIFTILMYASATIFVLSLILLTLLTINLLNVVPAKILLFLLPISMLFMFIFGIFATYYSQKILAYKNYIEICRNKLKIIKTIKYIKKNDVENALIEYKKINKTKIFDIHIINYISGLLAGQCLLSENEEHKIRGLSHIDRALDEHNKTYLK